MDRVTTLADLPNGLRTAWQDASSMYVDELAIQGPNRSMLTLDGFESIGGANLALGGTVQTYVLRFGRIFAGATVVSRDGTHSLTIGLGDYQDAAERTKSGARVKGHAMSEAQQKRDADRERQQNAPRPIPAAEAQGKTVERVSRHDQYREDHYDERRIITTTTLHFTDGTCLSFDPDGGGFEFVLGEVVETSECARPGCEVWIGRVVSDDDPDGTWRSTSGDDTCENSLDAHIVNEGQRERAA